MANLEFRHPNEDDIQVMVDIINTSNEDNPLWDVRNTKEFRKNTFEHDDWEAEGNWLAVLGGKAVGCGGGRVIRRRVEAGQNDGWIGFWVLPEHRGEGIEEELVKRSIEYIRSKGVAKAKHWDLARTNWRISLLEDFGFQEFKHEYILVTKGKDIDSPKPPEGLEFEEYLLPDATEEQLTEFMEVGNSSFSEDPDFTPLTMEYLQNWKDSTQDTHRALYGVLEDKIVGICLSSIEVEYNRLHNVKSGWIGFFAVLKEHRRKGIGRTLLVNGMRWLWDKGTEIVYLAVDEENPKALNLYTSVGFEVEQEGVTHSLEL
jgi:ribosomal protein S18 acetylase RimI-like enzyme